MRRLQTRGDRRARAAAGVHDVFPVMVRGLVEQRLNTGLGEAPRARVQRLLLSPDNGLGVGVAVEVLTELLPWEGVKLLDTSNGNVVDVVVSAVLGERSIDLSRAENDTVNLFMGLQTTSLVGRVGDDPAELRVAGELVNVRASNVVTKERLGEEDDKG